MHSHCWHIFSCEHLPTAHANRRPISCSVCPSFCFSSFSRLGLYTLRCGYCSSLIFLPNSWSLFDSLTPFTLSMVFDRGSFFSLALEALHRDSTESTGKTSLILLYTTATILKEAARHFHVISCPTQRKFIWRQPSFQVSKPQQQLWAVTAGRVPPNHQIHFWCN